MQQPGRNFNSPNYRYGFQGQEKDSELKGEGNSINYKYRMHDPRIGRFFAVDPLAATYPYYSPYGFGGNKVIQFIELEGLEESDNKLTVGEQLLAGWNAFLGLFGDREVVNQVVEHAAEIGDFDSADRIINVQKESSTSQLKSITAYAEIVGEVMGSAEIGRLYMTYVEGEDIYATLNEYGSLDDDYNPKTDVVWGVIGIIPGGDELKQVKHVKKFKLVDKVASGFYNVRNIINEAIYIGKGPSKRAVQSLKIRSGDKVIAYTISEGVAGLDIKNTSFAMEHLLIEKALEEGATLKNAIASPGKKIIEKLDNSQLKELVTEFNKIIEAGGEEIIKKK